MGFHYTGTPILAMAKRVAAKEKEIIDDFTRIYKVPAEVVETFTEPLAIARHFHQEIKQGMKEMGYSIDWRREFTTIDPRYNRFIEWQFRKLEEKGFITKGSHPVGWCPDCGNPVGQHDTLHDIEPEVGELTLIKFQFKDAYLPTGTLRPETIFGVTNLWVRPDVEYVKARIDGETWIISEECAKKLEFLGKKVIIEGKVRGGELIGKHAKNPMTGAEVLILPAEFIDPKSATGIVMSVPAHAPYDYVALEDLRREPEKLFRFNVSKEEFDRIKPIPLIRVEGFSLIPAFDIVQQYRIKNQLDPKLEDATKDVYSQEFHRGIMAEDTGKYAGKRVSEAKEEVREDLILEGKADSMYELMNRPVFCRCGAECLVKVFEDQWFINYGSPEWKESAYKCLSSMKIVPEILRSEFEYVIDWLKERACARKQGLGTKLPWDPNWIIESLSDSTIYMAYYIISKHIERYGIEASQLTDEVFDYVFLGIGDSASISERTGIDVEALKEMREEFLYFYPLDSRNSGRDLVPNHLTFFMFNHVAIFPEEFWPQQIVVNGSVLMEGKKMSKSLGNIVPLRDAIKEYGADPLRLSILATAEVLQDANFSRSLAESVKSQLERFYSFALDTIGMKKEAGEGPLTFIDRWMISQLQYHVKETTEALEEVRCREAIQNAFFLLNQDVQWYLRRVKADLSDPMRRRIIASILNEVLDVSVRLLAPFTPHLCEEIWSRMGKESFVSASPWPHYEKERFDIVAIEEEEIVKSLVVDTLEIIKVTGIVPKRICYYTSADWKWATYLKALEMAEKGPVTVRDLLPITRRKPEEVGKQVEEIAKIVNEMPSQRRQQKRLVGALDELKILSEAKKFFGIEFKAEICIYREDDPERYDPKERSKKSLPYRPAIYVE